MKKYTKGFFIIEVLIAIVILVMVVVSLYSTISFVLLRTEKTRYGAEAALLAQEGIEVSYNVLLSGWSSYVDGNYYPVPTTSGKWSLESGTGPVIKTRYNRKIELIKACRSITSPKGELIELSSPTAVCPGNVDRDSRIIRTTITWQEGEETKEVKAELLLFRFSST